MHETSDRCARICTLMLAVLLWFLVPDQSMGAAPPGHPQPFWIHHTPPHPQGFAISADGTLLAYCLDGYDTESFTEIDIWYTITKKKIATFRRSPRIRSNPGRPGFMEFTPDGKHLVILCWVFDRKAKVPPHHLLTMSIADGKIRSIELPESTYFLNGVLSRDGKTVIISGWNESLMLYDRETLKRREIIAVPEPSTASERRSKQMDLVLSPDGKFLAQGTHSGWLSVWDLTKKRRLWREDYAEDEFLSLSFSWDNKQLAALRKNSNRDLLVLNARTGKRFYEVDGRCTLYAGFLPGGDLLFERFNSVGFIRWNPTENTYRGSHWGEHFRPHFRDYNFKYLNMIESKGRMKLSADGTTLVLCCTDATKRFVLFDLRTVWPKR